MDNRGRNPEHLQHNSEKLVELVNLKDKFCLPCSNNLLFEPNSKVAIKPFLMKYIWWGNLRERDHWGAQEVDGRIILRWILRKWGGVVGTGWSWLRIGTGSRRL